MAASAEASYTVEAEVRTQNGQTAHPRVVTAAGVPAEIRIGSPDRPDFRLSVTPRPASSQTVTLEASADVRTKYGWTQVQFKTESRLGDHVRFEFGDQFLELRVREVR